jgi:hypothetical protein
MNENCVFCGASMKKYYGKRGTKSYGVLYHEEVKCGKRQLEEAREAICGAFPIIHRFVKTDWNDHPAVQAAINAAAEQQEHENPPLPTPERDRDTRTHSPAWRCNPNNAAKGETDNGNV